LVTSGRRWIANGLLKTTLVNWWVTFLFFLHIPPVELRRIYDGWLVSGKTRRDPTTMIAPDKKTLQGQA